MRSLSSGPLLRGSCILVSVMTPNFASRSPDEFLTSFLRSAIAKSSLDPSSIEDFCLGTTLIPGAPYVARASMLAAGIPYTTPMLTVSRFCATGLIAVNVIANRIRAGEINIGLAVGIENMSIAYVVILGCSLIPYPDCAA